MSNLAWLVEEFKKAEEHLHNEYNKLQTGRAHPSLIEWVYIDAYGQPQPLKNVASVSIMDAQTISIQPWDKWLLRVIDKWITDANLWFNPQNNGETIMIKVPTLTEERRKDLVKIAKNTLEDAKVTIRNIRQDYLKKIKDAEKNKEISEDIAKSEEASLQKEVDKANITVEEIFKKKEQDIMKV